jgi:hypothetical protein
VGTINKFSVSPPGKKGATGMLVHSKIRPAADSTNLSFLSSIFSQIKLIIEHSATIALSVIGQKSPTLGALALWSEMFQIGGKSRKTTKVSTWPSILYALQAATWVQPDG